MGQTPIEKAISELTTWMQQLNAFDEDISGIGFSIEHLNSLLPYEKTFHRNIAEKAWDAAKKEGYSIGDTSHPNKQTYLNQNHPL